MHEKIKRVEQALKPFRIWLYLALLTLVFVIQVLEIGIPMELLLVIVAAIALGSDRTQLLELTICFIPLFSMIQYLYALAVCMMVFVVKHHQELRWNNAILVLAVMFGWEMAHHPISVGNAVSAVRVIAPLTFCCFLMMIRGNQFHYPRLVRRLSIWVIVTSVIIWLRCANVSGLGVVGYILDGSRLGIVKHSISNIVIMNPNTWGFVCLMPIIGLLQLRVTGKGRVLDWVTMSVLFLLGTLTQSKTFFLCFAIALVLFMRILSPDRKAFAFRLMVMSGLGVIALILALRLFPNLTKPLLRRLVASDSNNLRIKIFLEYTRYLFTDMRGLLFGFGAHDLKSKIIGTFTDVPHNALQEIVVVWGIFGLAFFGLFMYTYIVSSKKWNKNQKMVNYIPLVLLLIKIQLGQFVTAGHTLLLLSFAYMSLCYRFYPVDGRPKVGEQQNS